MKEVRSSDAITLGFVPNIKRPLPLVVVGRFPARICSGPVAWILRVQSFVATKWRFVSPHDMRQNPFTILNRREWPVSILYLPVKISSIDVLMHVGTVRMVIGNV